VVAGLISSKQLIIQGHRVMTVLHDRYRHLSSTHHQLSCFEIAGFIYTVALPLFVSHYTTPTRSYLFYTWLAPVLPQPPCLTQLEQLYLKAMCTCAQSALRYCGGLRFVMASMRILMQLLIQLTG
jgi:hypothetical protein